MANDNVEDLIALARRGELSEAESRRLEMVLKTSDSARVLHEVGLDFERMRTERADDEALLHRVGTALGHGARGRTKARSKRGRRLLLLVAIALGSSAAAASVVGFRLSKSQGASASDPSDEAPSARVGKGPAPRVPEVPARPAPDRELSRPNAPQEPVDDAKTRRFFPSSPFAETTTALDASQLFKSANAARKAGQPVQALSTYRRLQQSFPSSPEARLSLVLSGRLYLAQGQPRRALEKFDQYLRGGGKGGLSEEALWGKAQALSRLGRSAEERQVWHTLLDRYPESVYTPAARRRLNR